MPETVTLYFENAKNLVKHFPDFILGFDLVGQEDLGHPLINFVSEIFSGLDKNPELKLFLHAGETDWQGSPTDLVRFAEIYSSNLKLTFTFET